MASNMHALLTLKYCTRTRVGLPSYVGEVVWEVLKERGNACVRE